jgi:hypothetical protein
VDCDDGAVHLCDENGTKTGQSRTLTEGQGPKILAIGNAARKDRCEKI